MHFTIHVIMGTCSKHDNKIITLNKDLLLPAMFRAMV